MMRAIMRDRPQLLQDAFKRAGGLTKLTEKLRIAGVKDISVQAMSQWTRIPARHVRLVARFSRIAKSKLRPDLYG